MAHLIDYVADAREEKCKCGASWAFIMDVGKDPKTGERKQKKKGGFRTKKEAEVVAAFKKRNKSRGLCGRE